MQAIIADRVMRMHKKSGVCQILTLKEPGGGIRPLDIFCYISADYYFFRVETSWLFSSSLALDLRPFF